MPSFKTCVFLLTVVPYKCVHVHACMLVHVHVCACVFVHVWVRSALTHLTPSGSIQLYYIFLPHSVAGQICYTPRPFFCLLRNRLSALFYGDSLDPSGKALCSSVWHSGLQWHHLLTLLLPLDWRSLDKGCLFLLDLLPVQWIFELRRWCRG